MHVLIAVSACFRAKGFWSRAYCQSKCYRLGEHKMKLYLTSCTVPVIVFGRTVNELGPAPERVKLRFFGIFFGVGASS